MNSEDQKVLDFLVPQMRDFGGNHEVDAGLWTLFAVDAANEEANALAQSLLAGVPFAHDSGTSEDDRWTLYYVETAARAEAVYWLDDLSKTLTGAIRPVSPAHRALIHEVAGSTMPHRLAQKLVEMHGRGEIRAGCVDEPAVVRALLDRLHGREPLFFSAVQSLLTHYLIDMIVLLQQLIPEDVGLENEIVKASLSRDPFLQSRQTAAADIRNVLIRFHLINLLDQQKNNAIKNPYAAHLEIFRNGETITASVDGTNIALTPASFVDAIRSIRRNLYRGKPFESFDTQAPWMREEIAYSFRFIKQRLESRKDLAPLDGLYMLERAVDV